MNLTNIEQTYTLAPNSIFWTLQGEGHLRGFQMLFVRLAGCSVGCIGCDTDYSVARRATCRQIGVECIAALPGQVRDAWAWVTGGEPTDHNLRPLLDELKRLRFSTCVATSGHKRVIPPVDWLSVSPHDPSKWVQTYGNEVKIVHGLNGFGIDDFLKQHPDNQTDFMYRYVQPVSIDGVEDRASLNECLKFLKHNPNWSLSRQDHIYWGVA